MRKPSPFLPPHVHKYIRKRYSTGYTIYKCVSCTHHVDAKILPGRESLCWRCGVIFKLLEIDAKRLKPHCLNCTRGREESKKIEAGVMQILEQEKIL